MCSKSVFVCLNLLKVNVSLSVCCVFVKRIVFRDFYLGIGVYPKINETHVNFASLESINQSSCHLYLSAGWVYVNESTIFMEKAVHRG